MNMEKNKNSVLCILIVFSLLFHSCWSNQMYFDEASQCLYSEDGYDLRWISIYNITLDSDYIIQREDEAKRKEKFNLQELQCDVEFGYDSIIPNIRLYYIFLPNCKFKITNRTIGDAGPGNIFLATDSIGHLREIQYEDIE